MSALVDSHLVLHGNTLEKVSPFCFWPSFVALNKKSGGVRPIAVGCTLRRLVAKVACKLVAADMAQLLAPRPLGYGGSEAVEHCPLLPQQHGH